MLSNNDNQVHQNSVIPEYLVSINMEASDKSGISNMKQFQIHKKVPFDKLPVSINFVTDLLNSITKNTCIL